MVAVLAGSIGLVAYTFAGYPAIVAALARVRPRPPVCDPSHTPSVTLAVLAYNEADIIAAKIENIMSLDYPREALEVIVVTDGSDDDTASRAREFDGVRVLHRPERAGKLAAMNRAAEAAQGEILVFSDANNLYERQALRELVTPFADAEVGMVTGRKAIDDGNGRALDHAEGLYWRYESALKRWETTIGSVVGAAGEILAFRRDSYVAPPLGTMNEDFVQAVLTAADGWRVVYAPRAVSLEPASATIDDEATRRSRLVTGRSQAIWRLLPMLLRRRPVYAWQVVSHKGLRPLVPWALLAAAASNADLARRRRWPRALAGAQLTFYATAALGWRLEATGRRNRVTYLPYYFCRMNLATLRGLRDFAAGRHEHVWARVRRG
jgi:cellulose synthase/poly-beta-1,6-N-acetylglucosamine synthase-like glycosyltransferase